jgi:hypothetical protein
MADKRGYVYGRPERVYSAEVFFYIQIGGAAISCYHGRHAIKNKIIGSGIAQFVSLNMGMYINKPGRDDHSFCINRLNGIDITAAAHPDDLSFPDGYISMDPGIAGAIQHASVFYQQVSGNLGGANKTEKEK